MSHDAAIIYRADALSGIINFILRKDGRGLTPGSQALTSTTGADNPRFNGFGAFFLPTMSRRTPLLPCVAPVIVP